MGSQMENLENVLKELIITRYGSLKKFADKIEIPWSTLNSVLIRGIGNSNISNIIKICKELDISVDEIANGRITSNDDYRSSENYSPDIRAIARGAQNLTQEKRDLLSKLVQSMSDSGDEELIK